MSFMVGSFAAGLSEGLDSGWKLGKDIQAYSREEDIRSATKKAQEDAKAKAALPSVAAKAPSVNDPDTSGPAGLSAGQTNLTETGWDDPTAHPDATTPPTLDKDGNAVPKTAAKPVALVAPWQSQIDISKVPDYYPLATKPAAAAAVPPATGPVVATAAIPPPLPPPEEMATEYPAAPAYSGPTTRQGAPAQPISNQLSSAWSWARGLIPTPLIPTPGPAAGTGGGRARTPAVPASTWGPMPPPAAPPPPRNQGLPTYLPPGSTTMPGVVGGHSGVIIQDQPAPTTSALPPPTSSLGPFESQPGSNDRPVRYDRNGNLVPY